MTRVVALALLLALAACGIKGSPSPEIPELAGLEAAG